MLYIVSLGAMIFDSLLTLAGSGLERSVTYTCTNLLALFPAHWLLPLWHRCQIPEIPVSKQVSLPDRGLANNTAAISSGSNPYQF